jgi:hypothetical protein
MAADNFRIKPFHLLPICSLSTVPHLSPKCVCENTHLSAKFFEKYTSVSKIFLHTRICQRNTKIRICPEKCDCESTNLSAKYSLKIRNMHLIPEVWTLRGGEEGDFHSAVVFSFNSCTLGQSYLILLHFYTCKSLVMFTFPLFISHNPFRSRTACKLNSYEIWLSYGRL